MRTVIVIPGACNRVSYTYRQPGEMRAVHLVCKTAAPRPPKRSDTGTGAGDREWLLNAPFLTADLSDDSSDGRHKVLFAIDAGADVGEVGGRALGGLGDVCTVAMPEADAEFVAQGMRMPLLVITEREEDKGFVAVYKKIGAQQP